MRKVENKQENKANTAFTQEFIRIQRLSSTVSGKAQKYSRIGPCEFVAYPYTTLTIDKIKDAYLLHFRDKYEVGVTTRCDILASERGPSCSDIKQLPDLKLIHIRFLRKEGCICHTSHSLLASCRLSSVVAPKSIKPPYIQHISSFNKEAGWKSSSLLSVMAPKLIV